MAVDVIIRLPLTTIWLSLAIHAPATRR